MSRRRGSREQGWAGFLALPGVLPILAMLGAHPGLVTFSEIRRVVPAGNAATAATVLRMLGSRDLVVRNQEVVGTWDEPDDTSLFELTERGREFAGAVSDLTTFVARLPRG